MTPRFLPTACLLGIVSASVVTVPAATLTYLDNGRIRLGLDLEMGGAVTYLAESGGGSNMINSWDHGRQVQLSFYSGPVPFQPPGSMLDRNWKALGWNPIQAGDAFGHGSKVTRWSNDGKTIRVRCVPLIWPLNNVPAQCAFEISYTLAFNTVEVASRLINARLDHAQYAGRAQELPAIYSNGTWYKLVSYLGGQPFTGGAPATLVDLNDNKGWPWLNFYGTEHWAALLDKNDRGFGVFEPDVCQFGGGFAGQPKGVGGPKDSQTGYIAPNLDEILDYNISYQFRYVLILGSLNEIRHYACGHSPPPHGPRWVFKADRRHWTYRDTTDAGWPIKGELRVALGHPGAALLSPPTFWPAQQAPAFQMEAALDAGREVLLMIEPMTDAHRQRSTDQSGPPPTWLGPVRIPITPDGKYRRYQTNLAGLAGYSGPLKRVKLILPDGKGVAKFRSIEFKGE